VTGPQPQPPVVVFDGDCGVCRAVVKWLSKRLGEGTACVSYQQGDLASYGISLAEAKAQLWYVDVNGRCFGGSDGFAAWLKTGPAGARAAGWLLAAPGVRTVSHIAYRVFARHRHRVPGPWDKSCSI
jgi:predicted DCC family thiol-disulfide oxidoreductase YuxK